ncbi:hypothetical protein chiPu_0032845, partial [Chiloscyllium punctatum]|nr:hypothetical protein [Chiloscyllium punctatum]
MIVFREFVDLPRQARQQILGKIGGLAIELPESRCDRLQTVVRLYIAASGVADA